MSLILSPYRFASGGGGSVSYIGGDYAVNLSAAATALAVPGAAVDGDTLVVILRCRADRTFTVPVGWTSHQARVIPSGGAADSTTTRAYCISKARAGETSLAFTQSVNASYGAALMVFRGGTVGANALGDGTNATITKAAAGSALLGVGIGGGGTDAPSPAITGYTQRGKTSFFSSPNYFYIAAGETKDGVGAGSTTATLASGFGTELQQAVWLAEIG